MEVDVNYLAVLLAAVASMVVGFLWYGVFFKKSWMHLMGHIPGSKGMMGPGLAYLIQFVASLAMACVLARVITLSQNWLSTSFWVWLGFIVPVTLGIVLWENKPWKLWCINASHYLVGLLAMGYVLSFWA